MKHFRLLQLFSLALVAISACMITSCADADEPEFDKAFSRSLSEGREAVVYKTSSFRLFNLPNATGKWKEVDLSEYMGFEGVSPRYMIIQDGKISTNYRTWRSAGPTLIGIIWEAYLHSTKGKQSLYLSRKFEINDEDSSISIDGRTFTVGYINKDSFRLIHLSEYAGGIENLGGTHKEVCDYKAAPAETINKEDMLVFETEKELMQGVINLAREHFGDTVDLNKVYSGLVEFDQPKRAIYNLDEVEAKLGLR